MALKSFVVENDKIYKETVNEEKLFKGVEDFKEVDRKDDYQLKEENNGIQSK